MAVDISNLPISSSFQDLILQSGSFLQNATGSVLEDIEVTASMATSASFATSASHAERSDTASVAISANAADSATSASYATTASFLDGEVVSASYAFTASVLIGAIESASFASTASFYGGSVTSASFADSSSLATNAEAADDILIRIKNTSGNPIIKGEAVYATGVTGENINVSPADNTDAATMPAIGIAQENISNNATGFAVAVGILRGIDTSNFTAGRNIYVGENGLTGTRPTGSSLVQNIGIAGKINASDGEIVVLGSGRSNDVPNLASGFVLVGNEDQVATAISTGSINVTSASYADSASIAASVQNGIDVDFNSGSFNDIVATTIAATNFTAVTSSVVITGDAFIQLNNDTPVQRYAGIIVQDSGSNNTASLQFDGGTNDWFYNYEGDDPTDFGVVMFGPEYSTKGSPTYPTANTIVKGDGGHHLVDTIITDDGSTVTVSGALTATGNITGDLVGNADTATSASFATQAGDSRNADSASNADRATSASIADSVSEILNQDLTISGSVNGEVVTVAVASNTASIDLSAGNFHKLEIPTAAVTHVTATNIKAGQTINLRVVQPSTTGSLTFDGGAIKFPSASVYEPSTISSATDVVSFVTFDGSTLLGTAVKQLV